MYIGFVRVKERMGGFGSYPSCNEVRYDGQCPGSEVVRGVA